MPAPAESPVKVESSILVWARETSGLTIAEVAKALNKDESLVKSWESGFASPTYTQLEKLAYKIYKRPLVVFFLPAPPEETSAKQDFRTLSDKDASELSPAVRLVIRKAKHHQVALKELYSGKNPSEKQIHKELVFKVQLDVRVAADRVRSYYGLNETGRKSIIQNREAFNKCRLLIEESGVFVFQHPLKDIRGFSLMDSEFPVITVNSSDAPTAKTFTLFHELCHILFNTGGVFRDLVHQEMRLDVKTVEQFCNAFASELLVPIDEIKLVLNNYKHIGPDWSDEDIRGMAAHFNVSKEVILRKLLDLQLTDKSHYGKLTKIWREQNLKFKEDRKLNAGAPPYQTQVISQLGKRFVGEILEKYHSGHIDISQASNYLGVKVNQLPKIENKM